MMSRTIGENGRIRSRSKKEGRLMQGLADIDRICSRVSWRWRLWWWRWAGGRKKQRFESVSKSPFEIDKHFDWMMATFDPLSLPAAITSSLIAWSKHHRKSRCAKHQVPKGRLQKMWISTHLWKWSFAFVECQSPQLNGLWKCRQVSSRSNYRWIKGISPQYSLYSSRSLFGV